MSASSRALGALVAVTLVACGGAAADSAPKAPSSVEPVTPAEPQTVEEAQAQLERARVVLSGIGGAAPSATTAPSTNPAAGTAQEPGAPMKPHTKPPSAGAQPASTCDQVCRAVTSMHRAKDAICRLVGPSDTRCADAQKKVADGDAQAVSCSCPLVTSARATP